MCSASPLGDLSSCRLFTASGKYTLVFDITSAREHLYLDPGPLEEEAGRNTPPVLGLSRYVLLENASHRLLPDMLTCASFKAKLAPGVAVVTLKGK
jgi:hypothetical protein